MKVRVKFKKQGALRFIGHLDVMRFFQKAMRRGDIPIAFTGGYSPHMVMSFANPLGIGLTSEGEYFDIELKTPISSENAVKQLNEVMVDGMEVVSFRQIAEEKKATGMAIVAAAEYLTSVKTGNLPNDWKEQLIRFKEQPEILIVKQTKRSEREVDIRPMIYKLDVQDESIYMQVAAGSVENLKPGLVMESFCAFMGVDAETLSFGHHRLEMYATAEENSLDRFISLEDLGMEIKRA